MHLVARLVAREVHVPHVVEELHAGRPLRDGQLHLTRKIVDMLEQRGEELAGSGAGIGANGGNDGRSKGGIEAVLVCAVCCHCGEFGGKDGRLKMVTPFVVGCVYSCKRG